MSASAIGRRRIVALAALLVTHVGASGCVAHLTAPPPAPQARYVRYDTGSDKPRGDDDMVTIGAAVEALQRDPKLHAGIIGHASSDGDAKRNKGLSMRRAQGVRDRIVDQGVASDRLVVAARGEDQPLASNDTEAGREKNRRVEVYFYYPERGTLQQQYKVKLEVGASASAR
jgi:hypothetical protein